MKRFAILLGILLFCTESVFCGETVSVTPEQVVNDNRATIAIQKQPAANIQKQEVKQNKWCIIVQINGKVKNSANNNKN